MEFLNKDETIIENKEEPITEEKTETITEIKDEPETKEEPVIETKEEPIAPMPEPIIEEPEESQPMPITFSPVPSPLPDSNFLEEEKEMGLVSVQGNPKVKRCTKCNTFVSANKSHSAAECASRLAKFNANRGKKKTRCCKTKKQNSRFLQKLHTLAKKYSTKKAMKKYKFPAPVRDLFKRFL